MSARTAVARGRLLALLTIVALVGAACATGAADDGDATADDAAASGSSTQDDDIGLSVAIASFDLAVGEQRRLLAGLYTDDAALLSFGEVEFELAYLGEEGGGEAEITQQVTASFLPVPGWEPEGSSDRPTLDATDGRGLYAGLADFAEPGNYGLRVVAELDDGREVEGQTVFSVAEETQVPDVGDEAPRTANHIIEDVEAGLVEPVAVDSRAREGADVPDAHLHDTRISDAIDRGWPVVVIVSTPVYCQTNFCGPLVETLAQTAEDLGDRAAFVHLEIYEEFDPDRVLNEAAAAWIQPADGSPGGEPWVFLVDADGTVAARWDNVLDLDELNAMLEELPPVRAQDDAEGDA